jgi:hypothetical protein
MDDLGTSIALDIPDTVIAGLRLSMAMAISSPVDFFLKHQLQVPDLQQAS